jgi:ketose-bisphosphate aldolase
MAFEKAGDILREAYSQNYGVAAFNVFNYETIKFAIDAAEEVSKPVIIQLYPGFLGFIPLETVFGITKSLAETVKAPVGLHLDHCHDLETIERALRGGFMSVMYDGSNLPFEENVEMTKKAAEAARSYGADVEAELGSIGDAADVSDYKDAAKFTEPAAAAEFFSETNAASLAVAVGNAHGDYSVLPELDFPRIKAISKDLNIPLVLHGGSGIPDEQLREAIKCGIAKVNIATEYFAAYYSAVEAYVKDGGRKSIYSCANAARTELIRFCADKINLLNANGG